MKLGLGLYRHMLNQEYFEFAKQCGCTHLILHLADYYKDEIVTATDEIRNYGFAKAGDSIWELETLDKLQNMAYRHGLKIEGIENFSPADWYDILLDGPQKEAQMQKLKRIVENAGKADIPCIGYNFSLAGVWGHQKKPVARGNAVTSVFDAAALDLNCPIPNGQVWNMTYTRQALPGNIGEVSVEALWSRLEWFLKNILPTAEKYGVKMALHPDDPPLPELRKTARLVYLPELYQKVLDLVPSSSNMIEFCMGSIQEMQGGNIYDAIWQYGEQKKIAYVHFRNVVGKVPQYKEVFVDEGDIDMGKVVHILQKCGFDGVLIPDHTPLITCDAPWHAGMAYALGYMKSILSEAEKQRLKDESK